MRRIYPIRPLLWIGSSKKDLKDMPVEVQKEIGHSLREIQKGKNPGNTKPLRHLHKPILEIVADDQGEAFRAAYTVEFEDAVVVLHVFHKKSKSGIATPKKEIDLILQRFRQATLDYHEWRNEQ